MFESFWEVWEVLRGFQSFLRGFQRFLRGFQRSSQRPSQRQISSQRLSVLLPLIVLPLELSPINTGVFSTRCLLYSWWVARWCAQWLRSCAMLGPRPDKDVYLLHPSFSPSALGSKSLASLPKMYTILFKIIIRIKLLFSNYLGRYSYSFRARQELISVTVTALWVWREYVFTVTVRYS